MQELDRVSEVIRFKEATLKLYGSLVSICLQSGSEAAEQFGNEIVGKLNGRIWGEINQGGKNYSSCVTAITLSTENGDITIQKDQIVGLRGI